MHLKQEITRLSGRIPSKNLKIRIYKKKLYCQLGYVVVKNVMVSYIKGGMQTKEDHEANIWAQERCKWGVEKASQ